MRDNIADDALALAVGLASAACRGDDDGYRQLLEVTEGDEPEVDLGEVVDAAVAMAVGLAGAGAGFRDRKLADTVLSQIALVLASKREPPA